MPALDNVDWEACLLEPIHNPEAERRVRKAMGIVPPVVRYFLDSVWWPDAVVALDLVHTPLLHVSPDLAEMVALVVSQESACRYCFNMTRGILVSSKLLRGAHPPHRGRPAGFGRQRGRCAALQLRAVWRARRRW
jgi:alkylhydroperoxidase family enzyme